MNTTTITAVVNRIAAVIEALTPEGQPGLPFKRSTGPNRPLRRWLPDAGGNAMFRLFEVRRNGEREGIGINDPAVYFISVPILVTVCYPAVPKLYDLLEIHDLEALIESDAAQIHDALLAPTALVSGHTQTEVSVGALDQTSEKHWFQDFPLAAALHTARRR
jgi:hypothetical protein